MGIRVLSILLLCEISLASDNAPRVVTNELLSIVPDGGDGFNLTLGPVRKKKGSGVVYRVIPIQYQWRTSGTYSVLPTQYLQVKINRNTRVIPNTTKGWNLCYSYEMNLLPRPLRNTMENFCSAMADQDPEEIVETIQKVMEVGQGDVGFGLTLRGGTLDTQNGKSSPAIVEVGWWASTRLKCQWITSGQFNFMPRRTNETFLRLYCR